MLRIYLESKLSKGETLCFTSRVINYGAKAGSEEEEDRDILEEER